MQCRDEVLPSPRPPSPCGRQGAESAARAASRPQERNVLLSCFVSLDRLSVRIPCDPLHRSTLLADVE